MAGEGVDLSGVLDDLLDDRGWRQHDLAKAAGIAREDINAFAKGRKRVGSVRLARLAAALGLTPDQLRELGTEGAPPARSLSDRLEAIATALEELVEGQQQLQSLLAARVAQLSPPEQQRPASPKRPKKTR